MDTEKRGQRRRDDARLTESGNARSEQLNTRGAYRVANQQSLAYLSGSERRRTGWFLDMKYQTCFSSRCMLELKFAIYYRAASLLSQASYAVLAEESQAFFKHSPHTNSNLAY